MPVVLLFLLCFCACHRDRPHRVTPVTIDEGVAGKLPPIDAPLDCTHAPGYEGFAEPFLEKYCLRCHNSHDELIGRAKPYDSKAAALVSAELMAASTHWRDMPKKPPYPTAEEILRFDQWAQCSARVDR